MSSKHANRLEVPESHHSRRRPFADIGTLTLIEPWSASKLNQNATTMRTFTTMASKPKTQDNIPTVPSACCAWVGTNFHEFAVCYFVLSYFVLSEQEKDGEKAYVVFISERVTLYT